MDARNGGTAATTESPSKRLIYTKVRLLECKNDFILIAERF